MSPARAPAFQGARIGPTLRGHDGDREQVVGAYCAVASERASSREFASGREFKWTTLRSWRSKLRDQSSAGVAQAREPSVPSRSLWVRRSRSSIERSRRAQVLGMGEPAEGQGGRQRWQLARHASLAILSKEAAFKPSPRDSFRPPWKSPCLAPAQTGESRLIEERHTRCLR
jgi:hypothetical protein